MGQKQSYRLGEGNTRTMAADGEVAYNTEDDVFASVQVRPVDSEGQLAPVPAPSRQQQSKPAEVSALPQKDNVLERVEPMPTTPIKIAPSQESPQTLETSEVTVEVTPATPFNYETEQIEAVVKQVETMHIVNGEENEVIQEIVELDRHLEDHSEAQIETALPHHTEGKHVEILEHYTIMDRNACNESGDREHDVDLDPVTRGNLDIDEPCLTETTVSHSTHLHQDIKGLFLDEDCDTEQHVQTSEAKEFQENSSPLSVPHNSPFSSDEGIEKEIVPSEKVHTMSKVPVLPEIPLESTVHAQS
ncbi:hypothetical protein DdX_16875 [Ditylenchus destructor]|uniref:Uncharacterized protein n=1 Tax=Ditylenchus destructor TaxID=166010 RepID=A0AAD4MPP0_9BILA|nr:hypothetical protein DdX_16875 [Ditylenchus destructor]